MAKNQFAALHDAFAQAENNLSLTPEGNGGFGLNEKTMAPSAPNPGKARSGKPQTPAQHNAVIKAAQISARKRHSRVIKPAGL